MVFKLQFQSRRWYQDLSWVAAAAAFVFLIVPQGAVSGGREQLANAKQFFGAGQYFTAARYAFQASQELPENEKGDAYSWISVGLSKAGLYHTASYFFIRTLETGNTEAKRRALAEAEDLLYRVGVDLLRNHLLKYTKIGDYDARNGSAYLYAMGKDLLLRGRENEAIKFFNGMDARSSLFPFALQLRGTAHAIVGDVPAAISDFKECQKRSGGLVSRITDRVPEAGGHWLKQQRTLAEDLEARCLAGEARTYYQAGQFSESEEVYDRIPKSSFVWTDILFEQGWNAFAQQQYNRALGKLVTYKSPLLEFVYNSEVEVLAAHTYLMLCLYNDSNQVINRFNKKYNSLGVEVKRYVEKNSHGYLGFFETGKKALRGPLYSNNPFDRLLNRFVRSPYFQNLVAAEADLDSEKSAIARFASMQPGTSQNLAAGFPGFLGQVVGWRRKSVQELGGTYVKNSLIDFHNSLISDFEKMSFIKLEMLSRAKERLQTDAPALAERGRGNVVPVRKDWQYRWNFNGEFWADELGDYVFGLESDCGSAVQ